MSTQDKTKEELKPYFRELKNIDSSRFRKLEKELSNAIQEIDLLNDEKEKKAAELIIANLELKFQDKEKAKRAAELVIADIELVYQNKEKAKRAAELNIANKELAFQYTKKVKSTAELIIANKELSFQNEEIKKLVAELKISKEHAEQSDRLKSLFLANISHEIRTPMNGILGFADLLKEVDLTGDEQRKYISIIEKSGERMLNIINDIIDICKLESGVTEVLLKESNINEQMDYIYTFFKPETDRKKIRLSFKKSLPDKEAVIQTDREKIYSILTNLVKNAIKFTDDGSIEFGYDLKMESQTKVLEFFIKDTGIGIPKDQMDIIFDKFRQADNNIKMARQGAGLGLSIAKKFVELLGGEIRVESKEGKGSIFYFTIPYNTEIRAKKSIVTFDPKEVKKGQMKKLKVLIVEDEIISDFLITKILKSIKHELIHAETGIEAIEACRNNPDIDLILMDIKIPELNGYEATRQIREFNKNVIIIAQTAFAKLHDRNQALKAGCNDYITKPIVKNDLLTLIQKHFIK